MSDPVTGTAELTDADLTDLLHFTISLARRAGALILQGSDAIQREQSFDLKKNAGSLSTLHTL